ncbi:MAG: choline-sulfatase, partial [Pseudomonadota bacterium]
SVMYEDAVAVPLMMMGPGIGEGINSTPVSLTDVAATVQQTVGLEPRPAREPWMSRPLHDIISDPEPDRFILSEYHDGGSPCGITMLRYREWKYVYYASGHAVQLFNLDDDPQELNDLGRSRDHERQRDMLRTLMGHAIDPESVNRDAFADQKILIDKLGGVDALLAMKSFGHTPVG